MLLSRARSLIRSTYLSCLRHNQLNNAAALSFFFLLSLSPLLIFLVSLVGLLPLSHSDRHILEALSQIMPPDAMRIVGRLLTAIFERKNNLLSLGFLGAIWAASTGFNAMILALNGAYLAKEGRPFWKRQLVSLGLTIVVGAMVVIALILLFVGARVGYWLANAAGFSSSFLFVWPYLRWFAVVGFVAVSVEVLYSIAPNVKQQLTRQIPGAALAVGLWLASSLTLGWYLRTFAHWADLYGTLGATIALMLWFYFSSLAILIGAEFNAQIRIMTEQ